ncbi:hypothetical protein QNA08_03105 [Chelatococcus sp. SYSU_G07232]|uniref:Protein-L-isoaspartate O-methyltransferase n=1 Tax=Chelatococcus albus TaxID=3047466 RepID=A0ABT7ACY3_9HYPH|nr:hypothetical protein [Chelatococcus sp. SYSU_G07232]MDJ1157228.1 hypothetical protein [Chelatococcus sp. SYSU_G07232]
MPSETVEEARRRYAERIAARQRVVDRRIVAAFASVPREDFLGPGPWIVLGAFGYWRTADADPRHIYEDVLVALDPMRGINNGEPSLHAGGIDALKLRRGDRVAHIGCGTGYYTAIIAEIVGPRGWIDAYEIEADLAARARICLADRDNVTVHGPEDCLGLLPPVEAIYVCAGATGPLPAWLDALTEGGRLVFPLTDTRGRGVLMGLERCGAAFRVQVLEPVSFIPLVGGTDRAEGEAVAIALARAALRKARSLHRGEPGVEDTCLVAGKGWWLSPDPVIRT